MTVVKSKVRAKKDVASNYLYAPVARFGFALSASARLASEKTKRFLLRNAAADIAVAAIEARRSEFEDSVERKLKSARWVVEKRGSADDLADFEFDLRHGVIADFDERLISHPDQRTKLVMRYCVTVCSQRDDGDELEGRDEHSLVIWLDHGSPPGPQHSKAWVRFSCLEFKGKRLDELSIKEMREFHDAAGDLARDVKAAILGPYRRVLCSVLAGDPKVRGAKVSLSTVFSIDSFTVSVQDDRFVSAYHQIVQGDALDDIPEDSKLRANLGRLKDVFNTLGQELLPIDDLGFARGVYWIDIDEEQASLVGVANNSLADSTVLFTGDGRALKSVPSNVIGVLSGSMLASAI